MGGFSVFSDFIDVLIGGIDRVVEVLEVFLKHSPLLVENFLEDLLRVRDIQLRFVEFFRETFDFHFV